jgi:isocitrate dehydrogenase
MMLVHINQPEVAATVHNAWLATIEAGIHTGDIYKEGVSKGRVGTKEFTDAVIERLGVTPNLFNTVSYQSAPRPIHSDGVTRGPKKKKELVGVDVFLDWWNGNANDLGRIVEGIATERLKMTVISNRGEKVYPNGMPETFLTDHWRCRYVHPEGKPVSHQDVIELLGKVQGAGLDFIKTEHLYTFDGQKGYSTGQGE